MDPIAYAKRIEQMRRETELAKMRSSMNADRASSAQIGPAADGLYNELRNSDMYKQSKAEPKVEPKAEPKAKAQPKAPAKTPAKAKGKAEPAARNLVGSATGNLKSSGGKTPMMSALAAAPPPTSDTQSPWDSEPIPEDYKKAAETYAIIRGQVAGDRMDPALRRYLDRLKIAGKGYDPFSQHEATPVAPANPIPRFMRGP